LLVFAQCAKLVAIAIIVVAALTLHQTVPSVTRAEPQEPTGFNVEGTGIAITGTGEGQIVSCKSPPLILSGITLDLDFSQSDGTVSGAYEITGTGPDNFIIDGTITDGTSDGSIYSLTGEGESLCPIPLSTVEITINGDCGDDVTINYEEPQATGAFLGSDVDCSLTNVLG
jgi:hypothetical protein